MHSSRTRTERDATLLGLAEARRRRRRTRIEGRLRGGWALARSLGDAELVARAAVGSFRGHVMANPAWHESTIRLLEDALALLPREDSVQRSQVLAALSLELYFTPQRERGLEVGLEGIAMARRVGDDEALAFGMCAHGPLGSGSPRPAPHRRDRAGRSERARQQSRAHVHRPRSPRVRSPRAGSRRGRPAIGAGSGRDGRRPRAADAAVLRDVAAIDARARWALRRGAGLRGRVPEIGIAADNPDALVVWGTQAVILAWQRGEVRHLVEPAQQLLEQFPDLSALPAEVALVEALATARRGAHEAPRLRRRSRHARVRRDLDAGVGRVGRGVPHRRRPECARSIYERLAPYAQTLCVVSLNLSEMGLVSRALGVLASLMGDYPAPSCTSPTRSRRANASALPRTWRGRQPITPGCSCLAVPPATTSAHALLTQRDPLPNESGRAAY